MTTAAEKLSLEAPIAYSRGSVDNPLSPQAVRAKFEANAARALRDADVSPVAKAAWSLEHEPDLAKMVAPMCGLARSRRVAGLPARSSSWGF